MFRWKLHSLFPGRVILLLGRKTTFFLLFLYRTSPVQSSNMTKVAKDRTVMTKMSIRLKLEPKAKFRYDFLSGVQTKIYLPLSFILADLIKSWEIQRKQIKPAKCKRNAWSNHERTLFQLTTFQDYLVYL